MPSKLDDHFMLACAKHMPSKLDDHFMLSTKHMPSKLDDHFILACGNRMPSKPRDHFMLAMYTLTMGDQRFVLRIWFRIKFDQICKGMISPLKLD
jgi:hypothetical protein